MAACFLKCKPPLTMWSDLTADQYFCASHFSSEVIGSLCLEWQLVKKMRTLSERVCCSWWFWLISGLELLEERLKPFFLNLKIVKGDIKWTINETGLCYQKGTLLAANRNLTLPKHICFLEEYQNFVFHLIYWPVLWGNLRIGPMFMSSTTRSYTCEGFRVACLTLSNNDHWESGGRALLAHYQWGLG